MSRAVPHATRPLRGSVRVPGSKSLTNRGLVLAALADGRSELPGALAADDTKRLALSLSSMGAVVGALDQAAPAVLGTGGALKGGISVECGDGGTPARFLMALAALADGPVLVDGSARLRERPMRDGADLLAQLGVQCRYLAADGCLPIEVHARTLPEGGELTVGRTASSQFVSALLLIAPCLARGLRVKFTEPPTSVSYIALTLAALREWGARVSLTLGDRGELTEVAVGAGALAARRAPIEPDASSAVYWAAAAALVPGSALELTGLSLDSDQPDVGAIRALETMGAQVSAGEEGLRVACAVPSGTAAPLNGREINCETFPDGALAVIAASAVASGPSHFTGLGTLRVKESDRIAAMAANLKALGAKCQVGSDWLRVEPIAGAPRAAVLPAFNDHRIAMSFAVLGMRTGGVQIADPECVAKSYPGFWAQQEALLAAVP